MYTSQTRIGSHENTAGLYQRVKSSAGDAVHRTDELVRGNPASSALVAFSVGIGAGLLTALLLAPRRKPRPRWPTRASDQLSEALDRLVPQAVSRYLGRRS